MEENVKDNGIPQVESDQEEVVSAEEMNIEDAVVETESLVDDLETAPESAGELMTEVETADVVSDEAVDEIAASELILQEDDESVDMTAVVDDSDVAENMAEEIEEEIVEVETEEAVVEDILDEPTSEAEEIEPEIADASEEQDEVLDEAVVRDEAAMADSEWFVVHCYSGYENKVRHNLEQRIETMGMKDKIFDVVVPTEEEIEVKDGKRRTVERRVFPGYILVQMILNEDSWYVVRNTPGVTGFVGQGNEPIPLRPEEVVKIVKRMEAEAPRIKLAYTIGQKVRITDGPFNDFIGTVADIDMERAIVRVMVSFFGRETPVELDFLQVDKA